MTEGSDIDVDMLRSWIGCSETADDIITPALVGRFRATFGLPPGGETAGSPAPLALHWCLAPAAAPPDQLGPDGHALRGGFLPPVPLPRRMWAGGEIGFHRKLVVGDSVSRRSWVADVQVKAGRSGRLCFVTVEHAFSVDGEPAIAERQDLVFRDPPEGTAPAASSEPPSGEHWSDVRRADPVTLFRYSALTFNGHRIHYDAGYAGKEGYADLVVHGPYQATLLLDFAARLKSSPPRLFRFRGLAPLLASESFRLVASSRETGLEMHVVAEGGAATMRAEAEW